MEDRFFPLFINLKDKKVLIVGAGNIAFRKATTLTSYGAKVNIITREIRDERFLNLNGIEIEVRDFEEKDIEDKFLVVAATDDPSFNNFIFEICDKKNILINNITSKVDMNTRFSSVLETPEFTIGISAHGNPKSSKELKNRLLDIIK